MTIHRSLALAAFALSVAAVAPVMAESKEAPGTPSPDACLKAVNLLGASMGHTEGKDPDGRPQYKFRLRTSGLDYEATCDAETGVVGDVKPRFGTDTGAL